MINFEESIYYFFSFTEDKNQEDYLSKMESYAVWI